MDTKPNIKNNIVVILPAILTVFIIFFLVMPQVRQNRHTAQAPAAEAPATAQDKPLVGGERDEHGCLGPAGYSWSEAATACLREWEVDGEGSRQAVKTAVGHLGWQSDATVVEVAQARCPGCFLVKLEKNSTNERKTVTIDNWQVRAASLTPEECQALGGTPLNTMGGATCAQDEENLGEVSGFISPNICCVPKRDSQP
jgi:hypothetical protein